MKLTIYKDFCASLEAVFLTQRSVPHGASEGGSIVVFGWHHIQYGSGGLVLILATKNSGIQHLWVAQFVPLDLRRGWSADRTASQVEGSALGGCRIGRAYGGRRWLKPREQCRWTKLRLASRSFITIGRANKQENGLSIAWWKKLPVWV